MASQETIFVKILVPQKPFAVKEVLSVKIPAIEGPYMVLPRRAPTIKLLTDGMIIMTDDKGKTEKYFITSGIAKIRDNACSVLTRQVLDVSSVDLDKVKNEIKAFEEKKEKSALNPVETESLNFMQMIVGCLEKRNLS